ncbi:hypothetical protein glysoja_027043 [Glycine soja]|uniref:Uncharacterized protein n=1 Tax=Glycine soja TaxID=3848 RepID=A0A0B2QY39_GLYSO|nr:hypothetical protein glysoja_027043 [Glycine soja]
MGGMGMQSGNPQRLLNERETGACMFNDSHAFGLYFHRGCCMQKHSISYQAHLAVDKSQAVC